MAPSTSPVTYLDCVREALDTPGLVSEFERLSGYSLQVNKPQTGLEALIDAATGYKPEASTQLESALRAFCCFIRDFVWTRLPLEARAQQCWVIAGESPLPLRA